MNAVDIAILLLLVLSAVAGYRSGLIQSLSSLLGLVIGLAYASWNFKAVAMRLLPYLRELALSEALGFCMLVFLVMLIFGLSGLVVKKLIHGVGLGWLDRVTGLIFGFLQGALLVTAFIVTIAAFFPAARWLGDAQLAKYFLGSVHLTTQNTPNDLKGRILGGLHVLEKDSPEWLHLEK